jgi:hypothetical protein
VYTGNSSSRETIQQYEFYAANSRHSNKMKFNALLTTYEIILKDSKLSLSLGMHTLIAAIYRACAGRDQMDVPGGG